jgi:hypothetical protein
MPTRTTAFGILSSSSPVSARTSMISWAIATARFTRSLSSSSPYGFATTA